MQWNDLPWEAQAEINALPTVADQAEAWLMIHRVLQLRATLEEQWRITAVVFQDAATAVQAFAQAFRESENRDFDAIVDGF